MLSLINWRLKITLNDGRALVGQMLAFDKHMNLVLADCEEFRRVRPKKKQGDPSEGPLPEQEIKRTLGLVILRGESVVSLSVEGPPPVVDEDKKTAGVSIAFHVSFFHIVKATRLFFTPKNDLILLLTRPCLNRSSLDLVGECPPDEAWVPSLQVCHDSMHTSSTIDLIVFATVQWALPHLRVLLCHLAVLQACQAPLLQVSVLLVFLQACHSPLQALVALQVPLLQGEYLLHDSIAIIAFCTRIIIISSHLELKFECDQWPLYTGHTLGSVAKSFCNWMDSPWHVTSVYLDLLLWTCCLFECLKFSSTSLLPLQWQVCGVISEHGHEVYGPKPCLWIVFRIIECPLKFIMLMNALHLTLSGSSLRSEQKWRWASGSARHYGVTVNIVA